MAYSFCLVIYYNHDTKNKILIKGGNYYGAKEI